MSLWLRRKGKRQIRLLTKINIFQQIKEEINYPWNRLVECYRKTGISKENPIHILQEEEEKNWL